MAFLRTRASGIYALVFKWKGKQYIKSLGTKDRREAEQIKKDAEDQLARIRNGRSALASKLLADGHSIIDVLFGSDEIAHLIDSPTDDNPLTLSELRDSFVHHLRNTDRTPGHIEGTLIHINHFIRILGDVRVMTLTDASIELFQKKREKEKTPSKRTVSPGTFKANFKSLKSAVNWAMKRKPPLMETCPLEFPTISGTGRRPFLPTEEIERLLEHSDAKDLKDLYARWLLELDEINELVKLTATKMPEMLLPMQLVCTTGMRRIQLVRLGPTDYVSGSLTIRSRKGARQKGLADITLTVELKDSVDKALKKHVKSLPKRAKILFPIFDQFEYSGVNARRKDKSKRTVEQRRCDKADRLFEKLVRGTKFERLDGFHALRHSFISILVSQGKTWDQIAGFAGHLDRRTTQRYVHFIPKEKRETINSIPFEF